MLELDKYRMAFFDCDGVILDSNRIKTEAFRNAVSEESPQLVEKFVQFHQENGGVSRYIKFQYFYKDMMGLNDYGLQVEEALQRYASEIESGLLICSEVDGVIEVLKYLNNYGIPCFVISGGDEAELNEVFQKRRLNEYFTGIFGSPSTKVQNLDKIEACEGIKKPSIFFGDSKSDLEAAENHGIDFIYVTQFSEWDEGVGVCQRKGWKTIHNFLSEKI